MPDLPGILGGLTGGTVGVAIVELVGNTAKLKADFAQARGVVGAETKAMEGQVSRFGTGAKLALAAVGVIAVASFAKMAEKTAQVASEVRQLHMQLGLTYEEASKLRYAAGSLGISVDSLTRSFGIFSKHLVDGGAAFAKYDITLKDGQGHQKDFLEILGEVSDKFVALPEGPQRTAFALDLFGRSGKALIPLLAAGKDALAGFAAEAQNAGLIMDEKTVMAAKRMQISQHQLQLAFQGLEVNLGAVFVPIMTAVSKGLTVVVEGFDRLPTPIKNALGLILAGSGAVLAFGLAWGLVKKAIDGLPGSFLRKRAAQEISTAGDVEATAAAEGAATANTAEGTSADFAAEQMVLFGGAADTAAAQLGLFTDAELAAARAAPGVAAGAAALGGAGAGAGVAAAGMGSWFVPLIALIGAYTQIKQIGPQTTKVQQELSAAMASGKLSANDLRAALAKLQDGYRIQSPEVKKVAQAIGSQAALAGTAGVSWERFKKALEGALNPQKSAAAGSKDLAAAQQAVADKAAQAADSEELLQSQLQGTIHVFDLGIKSNRSQIAEFLSLTGQNLQDWRNNAVQAMTSFAKDGGTELTDFVNTSTRALADWRNKMADSLNFVAQDLHTLGGNSKLTARDIIKDFDAQLKAMGQYRKDWQAVAKSGIAGSKDFLQAVAGMGQNGAVILHALATGNKQQMRHVIADWQAAGKQSQDLAGTIQQTLLGSVHALVDSIREALSLPPLDWKAYADTKKADGQLQSFVKRWQGHTIFFQVGEKLISGGGTGHVVSHGGGLLKAHFGAGPLRSDEVDVRARVGEFIVRSEAVNQPGVLPWLMAINALGGRSAVTYDTRSIVRAAPQRMTAGDSMAMALERVVERTTAAGPGTVDMMRLETVLARAVERAFRNTVVAQDGYRVGQMQDRRKALAR